MQHTQIFLCIMILHIHTACTGIHVADVVGCMVYLYSNLYTFSVPLATTLMSPISTTEAGDKQTSFPAAAVGAGVGVGVLVAIAVFVVLMIVALVMHKRRRKKTYGVDNSHVSSMNNPTYDGKERR